MQLLFPFASRHRLHLNAHLADMLTRPVHRLHCMNLLLPGKTVLFYQTENCEFALNHVEKIWRYIKRLIPKTLVSCFSLLTVRTV